MRARKVHVTLTEDEAAALRHFGDKALDEAMRADSVDALQIAAGARALHKLARAHDGLPPLDRRN